MTRRRLLSEYDMLGLSQLGRATEPSLEAKRIVVAEADGKLRQSLIDQLESEACTVIVVTNAVELASVLVGDEIPHLLLIALWLGDANSLEVIDRHPAPNGGVWPTVLMSANLSPTDINLAMKMGVARMLWKPFKFASLKEALLSVINDASHERDVVDGLTLLDLLQAFHLGQRTLGLAVSGNPAGNITLVRGEVVDAQCGVLVGEHALDLMVLRSAKAVQPFDTPRAIPTSIDSVPFDVLLAGSLRRIHNKRLPRKLTKRDSAAVMAAVESKRTGGGPKVASSAISELPFSVSGAPPALDCGKSSQPPSPSSRPLSSSSPPFSSPTEPPRPFVQSMAYPDGEEATVLGEEREPPSATVAELVLLSQRGSLVDELHFARVSQHRLSLQWLTPGNALTQDVKALIGQLVSLVVIDEERPVDQWLAVIRRDSNGVELGASVFGQRPWVCAAVLSGRLRRARFFSTTARLATSAVDFVEPGYSRQHELTLADLEVGDLDGALSQICRTLVNVVPAVDVCMLVQRGPTPAKLRRGMFGVQLDEVVAEQRWRTAERVLRALFSADDVEMFIGTTGVGQQILMGLALEGQWLLLCLSGASRTLGALRNKVRARLPWLRDALNNKSMQGNQTK